MMESKPVFLFMSPNGDAAFLAQRVSKTYPTYLYIKKEKASKIFDDVKGVEKVDDYNEVLLKHKKEDLVIWFDQIDLATTAEKLRQDGYNVYGSCQFAKDVENDRELALSLTNKIDGIKIPPFKRFNNFEDAKALLEGMPPETKMVIKPDNEFVKVCDTYMSENIRDMQKILEVAEYNWQQKKEIPIDFILQQKIEGIEMSIAAYWDGKRYVPNSATYYFEEKKFMPGNYGPSVGCAGAVMWFVPNTVKLMKFLDQLALANQKMNYKGQIDMNFIFTEKEAYFLEYCYRVGYDSLQDEIAIIEKAGRNVGDYLLYLAGLKQEPENFIPTNIMALDVRLSAPPYPEGDALDSKGYILDFPKKYESNMFLGDVRWNKEQKCYESTGADGVVCIIAVAGKSIPQLQEQLYKKILPNVCLKNKQLRSDIGDRVQGDYNQLKQWGWV